MKERKIVTVTKSFPNGHVGIDVTLNEFDQIHLKLETCSLGYPAISVDLPSWGHFDVEFLRKLSTELAAAASKIEELRSNKDAEDSNKVFRNELHAC
jgi:hypothetical protein